MSTFVKPEPDYDILVSASPTGVVGHIWIKQTSIIVSLNPKDALSLSEELRDLLLSNSRND